VATKTIVEKVCDLTGLPADETVEFGLADKAYRVDLTAHHAEALREILADYIRVAQPIGKLNVAGNGHKARSVGSKPGSNREHLAAVRAWLRQQGETVNDRGRIAADQMAKFDAAHASPAVSAPAAYEPSRGWA
jgi:hypothetical protein